MLDTFPQPKKKWIETGGGVDNGYYFTYYDKQEVDEWRRNHHA